MGFCTKRLTLVLWITCIIPNIIFAQSKLCTGVLGEPIISKDFGSGTSLYNTSAQTTYGFSTTFSIWNKAATNDGYYSVVNRIPNDFQLQNTNVWLAGEDHTPNDVGGYMMLVNADEKLGEFYRDTVTNLCVGGTYEFSSYLANIFKPANAFPTAVNSIPPKVRFEIRNIAGVVIDSISTGNITNTATLNWQKFGITFTAPATSVILVMISTAARGIGNDIVLDDIAFRPCTPATISITPTVNVCEGGSGIFTVRVEGNADYKYSRWQISRDGGTTWDYLGNTITQTSNALNYTVDLSLSNIPFTDDSTTYRLVLSTTEANLTTVNSKCNVISPTSLLRVYQYPFLTITDPSPVCNATVDITQASVIAGSTLRSGTLSYYTTLANANVGTNALTTNQAKSIASSGQYFIRIATNTNPACTDIKAVNVVIVPARKLSLSKSGPLCKSNANFTITATKTNITNLSWTEYVGTTSQVLSTGSSTSVSITPTATDLTQDSIWIKVSSTDDASVCPNVKDSVKVILVSLPLVSLPADTQICHSANQQQFKIPFTFQNAQNTTWSVKLGTLSKVDANTLQYTFKPSTNVSSKDSISITVTNAPCPPSSDYRIITYIPNPTLKAQNDTTACIANNKVRLKATSLNTNSHIWTSNGAGSFSSPNALVTTFQHDANTHSDTLSFFITASSASCGSLSDTVVYIYEKPLHVSASNIVSCIADLSTVLKGQVTDGTQNLSSLWNSSGTGTFGLDPMNIDNTYIPSAADVTNGFVNLTLQSTGQRICPNKDTTLRYNINPLPIADAGPDSTFCTGITFSRNIIGNTKFTYQWTTIGSNGVPNPISTSNAISLTPTEDTKVLLSVRNAIGCLAKDSFQIKVIQPPVITLPTHLCLVNNLSIRPVLSPTTGTSSYIWTKDQQVISTLDSISSINISAVGIYSFQYVNQNCKSKASTLITKAPDISIKDQTDCISASVTLRAQKMPKTQYFWNGTSISTADTLVVQATPQPVTVTLQIEDSLGCTSTTSAVVRGVPYPEFDMNSKGVCVGAFGKVVSQLRDSTLENTQTINYQWTLDQKSIHLPAWKTIEFEQSGLYALSLSIGNCKVTHQIQTAVYPLPVIQMKDKYVYCNEDPEPVRISTNDTLKHAWYFENNFIGNTKDLEVHPDVPSSYRLEVESKFGCKSSKPVFVDICCAPRLFVPNVITPYSKDVNASLNIYGANFMDFELTVFNRWGEIIYNTKDPEAAWDGSYRGEGMPIGVYPWIITYDAVCPYYKEVRKLKGDVTVVR